MSKSALASLTAQYTDSENEDDNINEDNSDIENAQVLQVIKPEVTSTTEGNLPERQSNEDSGVKGDEKKKKRRKKSVRRLVSYQDDTIISDEDDEQISDENEDAQSESEKESDENVTAAHEGIISKDIDSPMEVDDDGSLESQKETKLLNTKNEKLNKYAHYSFTLPPEPKGKPSVELVEKIKNLYDKMESNNMDMNRIIQERKEFRNPSIYEKLIQYCDINEFGTNYPPEIYDPLQWGPESYYEELARVQKNEMVKRQKERKDTDKIEQATALARKVEEDAKKRKSKWDQPAAVKPVVPVTLTTTVTGTKGTVISAFGSLPKKPIV